MQFYFLTHRFLFVSTSLFCMVTDFLLEDTYLNVDKYPYVELREFHFSNKHSIGCYMSQYKLIFILKNFPTIILVDHQ